MASCRRPLRGRGSGGSIRRRGPCATRVVVWGKAVSGRRLRRPFCGSVKGGALHVALPRQVLLGKYVRSSVLFVSDSFANLEDARPAYS